MYFNVLKFTNQITEICLNIPRYLNTYTICMGFYKNDERYFFSVQRILNSNQLNN